MSHLVVGAFEQGHDALEHHEKYQSADQDSGSVRRWDGFEVLNQGFHIGFIILPNIRNLAAALNSQLVIPDVYLYFITTFIFRFDGSIKPVSQGRDEAVSKVARISVNHGVVASHAVVGDGKMQLTFRFFKGLFPVLSPHFLHAHGHPIDDGKQFGVGEEIVFNQLDAAVFADEYDFKIFVRQTLI